MTCQRPPSSSTRVEVFRFAEAAYQHIKLADTGDAPGAAHRLPLRVQRTGVEQEAIEEQNAQDFIAKHQRNIEQVLCWRIRATLRQQSMTREKNSSGWTNTSSRRILAPSDDVDRVDDARQVAEERQHNVDPELQPNAHLEEHSQWWQQDGKNKTYNVHTGSLP